MAWETICPACGAHLDAGEMCDCGSKPISIEDYRARQRVPFRPKRQYYDKAGEAYRRSIHRSRAERTESRERMAEMFGGLFEE